MQNKDQNGTVEMPVAMVMMMAQNEQAIASFGALSDERRNEYIRRAKQAQSSNEMRSVINDIIKIG